MSSSKSSIKMIDELCRLSAETEWIEFKLNHQTPEKIGEYISALANSACLHYQPEAFLIFGIQDKTHKVRGTTFDPWTSKGKGNEDLIPWLSRWLKPQIEFEIKEIIHPDGRLVVFYIPPATNGPVSFLNDEWIRVGTSKKKLLDYKDKEAVIWERRKPFEEKIAKKNISEEKILDFLDYDKYYRLVKQPIPKDFSLILERFIEEGFLKKRKGELSITNLGALLLARDLDKFPNLKNKAPRVITYDGVNKLHAKKDRTGRFGYASGFSGLISYIESQLPDLESITGALRIVEKNYPIKALREFTANALVHQDFNVQGCPIVEIYSDRIEIINPGKPLIQVDRFIDHPSLSRNEKLTEELRMMRICEKRGSGVDRAFFETETLQLPPPKIEAVEDTTRVILYFVKKELADLTKIEQLRSCYYHCCIKYFVLKDGPMTNASLCQRLGILEQNKSIASRIIKLAKDKGLIKDFDPDNKSPRLNSYIPFWS